MKNTTAAATEPKPQVFLRDPLHSRLHPPAKPARRNRLARAR